MSTSEIPTVEILLFANAAELAGTRSFAVSATTVGAALDLLVQSFPMLANVVTASQCWVNHQPAGPETVVSSGDELAIIPPVSGG